MNILLQLFLTFLKIGVVSFGGGYGMISIIIEECTKNKWMSENEVLNFIAVSESTPGPIAVNMATFIGSNQAGFLGALLATIGVVLPSFIIILFIAIFIKNFLKLKVVKAMLKGIEPVIVGLILATGIQMILTKVVYFNQNSFTIDADTQTIIKSISIFLIITLTTFIYKKIIKKEISPIILIIFSSILGIIFFS